MSDAIMFVLWLGELNLSSIAITITSAGVLARIAADWSRLKTIQENMVTKAGLAEEISKLDEKFVTRREWNMHVDGERS